MKIEGIIGAVYSDSLVDEGDFEPGDDYRVAVFVDGADEPFLEFGCTRDELTTYLPGRRVTVEVSVG